MRLGTEATLQQLLDKLEGIYGTVELHENVMTEFYSSKQQEVETAAVWGCRLESILDKAVERGQANKEAINEMLRTKFWTGLKPELKDATAHKYEIITSYEELLKFVRCVEHERGLRPGKIKCITKGSVDSNSHLADKMENKLEEKLDAVVKQVSNQPKHPCPKSSKFDS